MRNSVNVTINGNTYPLNFSTRAAMAVSEKFGGLENMKQKFASDDLEEQFGALLWITHLLLDQGAKYRRIVCGEAVEPPPIEELEVLLDLPEMMELLPKVMAAITGGLERTVEADTGKNGEATRAS